MKYARDLKKVESQAPQVFKGSFINYEGLKKFLKYRARQLNQIPEQSAAYVDAVRRSDTEFLRMLAGQLKEVDRWVIWQNITKSPAGIFGAMWLDNISTFHACNLKSLAAKYVLLPGDLSWKREVS